MAIRHQKWSSRRQTVSLTLIALLALKAFVGPAHAFMVTMPAPEQGVQSECPMHQAEASGTKSVPSAGCSIASSDRLAVPGMELLSVTSVIPVATIPQIQQRPVHLKDTPSA